MAAGPFVFPDLAKLNCFSVTNLLGANAANFKLALISSAWVPANSTDEVFATPAVNEIAAANGYAAGGIALTSVTLTQTAGTVKFTCAAASWTATGGSIAAWRRGVVYYLGTLNGKINPIVGHFLGDNTPADVPATTAGNPLGVTPSASGILSAT